MTFETHQYSDVGEEAKGISSRIIETQDESSNKLGSQFGKIKKGAEKS